MCEASRKEFQEIYDILDVKLHERGESFYNPLLKPLVDELVAKGFARESDGAICMFVEGFKNRDGSPLPLIIQKNDGGYTYATTDLAAVKYRCQVDKAARVLYVTDAGQAGHFSQIFQAAKEAGLAPEVVSLEYVFPRFRCLDNPLPHPPCVHNPRHVPFGVVQGEDGKKLKTRSGEFIKLKDLLSEAVNAATTDMKLRYKEEGKTFDAAAERYANETEMLASDPCGSYLALLLGSTARTVGIAAVKYADLSLRRTSDYRFSYSKMLALHGNTAPYMLYAYARIMGIRRNDPSPTDAVPDAVRISEQGNSPTP